MIDPKMVEVILQGEMPMVAGKMSKYGNVENVEYVPLHQTIQRLHDAGYRMAEASEKEGVGRVKCDCDRKCDRDAVVSFVDDIEGVTVPTCAIHAKAYRRNTDTWKETALRAAHTVDVEAWTAVKRTTDALAYIKGIVEWGIGHPLEDAASIENAVLNYVKSLEAPTVQGYSREQVRRAYIDGQADDATADTVEEYLATITPGVTP
jgi:hypothetical protein